MFARHISLLALTLALSTNCAGRSGAEAADQQVDRQFRRRAVRRNPQLRHRERTDVPGLKAPAIGDTIQLGVVHKGGRLEANQVDGDLILNENVSLRKSFLEFGVKAMGQRAMFVNLPRRTCIACAKRTSIRIRSARRGSSGSVPALGKGLSASEEAFAVTQMAALLKTLDTCAADLRKIWKVWSDNRGDGLKEGPSANLAQLFSPEDYPGVAALKGSRDESRS